jgi:hypothetical protein
MMNGECLCVSLHGLDASVVIDKNHGVHKEKTEKHRDFFKKE